MKFHVQLLVRGFSNEIEFSGFLQGEGLAAPEGMLFGKKGERIFVSNFHEGDRSITFEVVRFASLEVFRFCFAGKKSGSWFGIFSQESSEPGGSKKGGTAHCLLTPLPEFPDHLRAHMEGTSAEP